MPSLLAICGFSVLAAQQDFVVEPIPDWTTPVEIKEYNNPLEKQAVSGVFSLLFDVEINGESRETFFHIAHKFISPGGVQANSRLSFDFDPSYQQLILHKIVIHRGSQVLDQLVPGNIRVIQQEKDLDRQIYNGAKTAILFLEDVRVGDWVEFAYTARGRNPIENGHFYDVLRLRWPIPIQVENYRLLWPRTNQPLWLQACGDVPKNANVTDHFLEYAWHWENRPAEEIEDYVPPSAFQYALVHFSDFRTWKDVAIWAGKSFRPKTVSQELHQKIMQFKNENTTAEQRVIKALQFVQDDVRYLGIENGINSHQPTDPSIVFARGYGDCKDKSLLFCTILRFFEVDASPVIVSSRFQGGVNRFTPSPLFFDHAIVQVILSGKTNYVDLTRPFQRGPLDRRFVDYFGAGVVLDEDIAGLVEIPATNAGMPRTLIEEEFNVSTNGATDLVVKSTFEGRDADMVRQSLASVSQDASEKLSLAYYQKSYSGIVTAAPSETRDNELLDAIQVTRRYFIPNIWTRTAQTNVIACGFVSHGILERLYMPLKKERKRPLAVLFPENYIHRMQIEVHEPWRILPKEKTIQTKAFLFHGKTTCTNNQITIVEQVLTLNPEMAAEAMPEYWAGTQQIPRFLGLEVTKPAPGTVLNAAPNWSIWIGVISYSVILLMIGASIYRRRLKSPPAIVLPTDSRLRGLGGWLILLGFGLIVSIPVRVVVLVRSSAVFSIANWRFITDPSRVDYDASTAPLLLYELFYQLTLIFFAVLLVILYFQKRRRFATLVIIYLCVQFIGATVDDLMLYNRRDTIVTTAVSKHSKSVAGTTVVPLILWGLYIFLSKRVKATFVN